MENVISGPFDDTYWEKLCDTGIRHAVFDVDNTIIRTNITELYFNLRKKANPSNWTYGLELASFVLGPAPYYLWLDFRDRERFQRAFYKRYHPFPLVRLEEEAVDFFERSLKRKFISHIHDLIFYLKKRNIEITLLSTNFEPVIRPIEAYFGVPYQCLKVNDCPSGCEVDLTELQDFKGRMIRRYDPAITMAVADSKHDLPVLRHVGHPVVVGQRQKTWMSRIGKPYDRVVP